VVGLHDLRCSSSTYHASTLVALTGSALQALVIPPGVAHGFFFPEPSLHIYAVSHYWNTEDELGCRWDDPELKLPWPCETPILSQRDANLGTFAALNRLLNHKLASEHS
jgi:dTDP-4-dehydrorhamnose 3,5-epimerase